MDPQEYEQRKENCGKEIEARWNKLEELLTESPFMALTSDLIYRPKTDFIELEEVKNSLSLLEGMMIAYHHFAGEHYDAEKYERVCKFSEGYQKITPNVIQVISTTLKSLLEDISKLDKKEAV